MGKIPNFLLFSLVFSLFFLLNVNLSFAETIYPYWIDENLDVWIKINLTANGQITLYIQKVSGYSPETKKNIFDVWDDFNDEEGVSPPSGWSCEGGRACFTETSGYAKNNDETYQRSKMFYTTNFFNAQQGIYVKAKVYFESTQDMARDSWSFCLFNEEEVTTQDRCSALLTMGRFGVGADQTNGKIVVFRKNSTDGAETYSASFSWSEGVWYEVEIWYDGNTVKVWVDGSLKLDYTFSQPPHEDLNGYLYHAWGTENAIVRIDYTEQRKKANPEPSVTITDKGDHYEVVITEQSGNDLTNYQIKLDGSQLGISSQSESLKITESINQAPTISIISPQNQTYYTTSLNLKFKVADDNSTIFWVKAYFNDSLIYNNTNYQNNTEITIDLQPYLSDWMKTISVKVWANDTDQNNPQISEKTVYFTLDLYDFSFNISNYTEFNNSKYAENLIYSYSARCGYLNHNATIKIYANNSEIYSKEFVCDNSTITYQTTYKHANEGLVNLTAKLLNYAGETKANQTYEYYNDLNPPIVDVSTTLHIGFFINYPQENATYNVTDTISPYVICSYYFGNANGTDNITRANYSKPYNYTYNLIHGNSTLKVNCTDILNHSTEQILIQKAYLFQIKPIDEETGLYDTDLWTDVSTGNSSHFRFTSFDKNMNESFIFENISETIYLVLSPTKSWLMRFEQEYTDQIISDIYDLDYAPPILYICVAADKPTVYQTAYSSVPIEGKAFSVTRSDTGCVKTISETQLIEDGYGFNFYTMSGHYALWYIPNEFAWDQKTLLASFSGDAQITLDLEKALLLAQEIEQISIPSFNFLYISRYNNENATLIRYLSPETLSYFQINFTKEGEDEPFYTQTLTEASAIRLLLYWKNFDLSENEIIHVSYYAKFPDGRIDKGSIRTTPTGREIWFRWWECAIIMFMPMVLLFMRQLDWKNILAFSIIYVITALVVLPHAEMHIVTQAYGLLGVVALFMAGIILIKKV